MTEWIDRRDQEIPKDEEVLVIWKGRIGILYHESDTGNRDCAMMPNQYAEIWRFDDEGYARIDYWMPIPQPVFQCDFPKREK